MATVKIRRWSKNRKNRKLTDEQVERVRALPWERGSLARLAIEFDITKVALWNIRHGWTYKRPLPQATYVARITDGQQLYSLGSFLTPEAAQNAIDNFKRTNRWPRGSIEKAKGRYRVRLSLGVYDTRWAAERARRKALEILAGGQRDAAPVPD